MVMAGDRRKPQNQSTPSKNRKNTFLTYGIILILLAGAYLAGRYYRGHKYDSFAKCLADKQAKMYGLYWCPHCADQKADVRRVVPEHSVYRMRDSRFTRTRT